MYEEKLERRRKKEKETGKKMGGRPPQAPTPGPRKQDQVNFRGLEAVNGEWTLTCLAWNLKRMHALA